MKNRYLLFFVFLIVFLNFSCNKPDITPVYLSLTKEEFEDCLENDLAKFNKIHDTDYLDEEFQIIRQHLFKDVQVSINGTSVGFWQLPCHIPLIPEYGKTNNIRVLACVRLPNSELFTKEYLFVTPITQLFDGLVKGDTIRLSPFKLEYVPSVAFPILEAFIQDSKFSPRDTIYNTPMKIVKMDSDTNKNMGSITLGVSDFYFDVATQYQQMPGRGQRQYWEISYMSYNGEMVGYLGFEKSLTGIQQKNVFVLPSTEGKWKKVYFDATQEINYACSVASQINVRLGISGYKVDDSYGAQFNFESVKLITMTAYY
ncbi:MAG: hypothetical protein LBI45_02255 [Bacteroidales bacterium]|jgi:hypothetical protein|nr:hypothetical protein [Bacteroidales bacterium]